MCKERLPDGCTFEIGRLDPLHVDEVWDQWQRLAHNGPFRLDSVFGCAFMRAADVAGATLWLLWFYEGMCYNVATLPAGWSDDDLAMACVGHGGASRSAR